MGGSKSSIPSGPSQAEIEAASKAEKNRIAFEKELLDYYTNVGTGEVATRNRLEQRQASLEFGGGPEMPPISSLFIPERFQSAVAAGMTEEEKRAATWLNAENLGFYGQMSAQQTYEGTLNEKIYNMLQTGDASYQASQSIQAQLDALAAKGVSKYDSTYRELENIKRSLGTQQTKFREATQNLTLTDIRQGDWLANTAFKDIANIAKGYVGAQEGGLTSRQSRDVAVVGAMGLIEGAPSLRSLNSSITRAESEQRRYARERDEAMKYGGTVRNPLTGKRETYQSTLPPIPRPQQSSWSNSYNNRYRGTPSGSNTYPGGY